MPPALDTAEEVAAVLAALLGGLAVIITALITAAAGLVAVWRAKLKPLLVGTQAAAELSAHQLQNNSGTSTRDAIDRTERMTGHLLEEMRDMRSEQRTDRTTAARAHSEIFRRLRALETPQEDTRP